MDHWENFQLKVKFRNRTLNEADVCSQTLLQLTELCRWTLPLDSTLLQAASSVA